MKDGRISTQLPVGTARCGVMASGGATAAFSGATGMVGCPVAYVPARFTRGDGAARRPYH